jgi:hypothetical protein
VAAGDTWLFIALAQSVGRGRYLLMTQPREAEQDWAWQCQSARLNDEHGAEVFRAGQHFIVLRGHERYTTTVAPPGTAYDIDVSGPLHEVLDSFIQSVNEAKAAARDATSIVTNLLDEPVELCRSFYPIDEPADGIHDRKLYELIQRWLGSDEGKCIFNDPRESVAAKLSQYLTQSFHSMLAAGRSVFGPLGFLLLLQWYPKVGEQLWDFGCEPERRAVVWLPEVDPNATERKGIVFPPLFVKYYLDHDRLQTKEIWATLAAVAVLAKRHGDQLAETAQKAAGAMPFFGGLHGAFLYYSVAVNVLNAVLLHPKADELLGGAMRRLKKLALAAEEMRVHIGSSQSWAFLRPSDARGVGADPPNFTRVLGVLRWVEALRALPESRWRKEVLDYHLQMRFPDCFLDLVRGCIWIHEEGTHQKGTRLLKRFCRIALDAKEELARAGEENFVAGLCEYLGANAEHLGAPTLAAEFEPFRRQALLPVGHGSGRT